MATRHLETVCVDCRLVLHGDRLDRGPELRPFENDGTMPERTGPPLTASRHDRGLSTEIDRVEPPVLCGA